MILKSIFRYNQLHTGNIPKTLSNCVNLEEFNIGRLLFLVGGDSFKIFFSIENNCVAALPEGLLAALDKINSITLSR